MGASTCNPRSWEAETSRSLGFAGWCIPGPTDRPWLRKKVDSSQGMVANVGLWPPHTCTCKHTNDTHQTPKNQSACLLPLMTDAHIDVSPFPSEVSFFKQPRPPFVLLAAASRDSSPVMRSNSTLPVPQPSSAPPTPTRLTGANSDIEEEERGDLIQFYNNVYIKQIQTFAMKYSQANVSASGIIGCCFYSWGGGIICLTFSIIN